MSANTTLVPGKDFVFYKNDGGIWKPYACARSGSFSVQRNFINTSSPGTGNARSQEPTDYSFTGSVDGLMSLGNTGSILASDFLASLLSGERMLCRFISTSLGNDVFTKECYFYVSNYTDTGSFDGVTTFSVSLEGDGALTIVLTPPTPTTGTVVRYPAPGSTAPPTVGSPTVTIAGIGAKITDLLEVVKNGQGGNDIILAGTPVNQEVLAENVAGDMVLTWAYPFMPSETFYITYNN